MRVPGSRLELPSMTLPRINIALCFCVTALVFGSACSDDARPGILDSSVLGDSAPPRDSGSPTDGEVPGCPTGQHVCGGGCIDDLANDPDNGCRLGCGEACRPPANATAICTSTGACGFTCTPPATRTGDTCECVPQTCTEQGFDCGEQTDACGASLNCGACPGGTMCSAAGTCGCLPDDAESNDIRTDAHNIGTFDDADDPSMVFDTWTIAAADDVDWYQLSLRDGLDGGNPTITIDLTEIPAGANFDLAAYFQCESDPGDEDVTCNSGMTDNAVGQGCASASTGTTSEQVGLDVNCTGITSINDHGTVWIKVTPSMWSDSCAPYQIRVRVN